MTKSTSRRISASEWIQDHFSPVVGVLSSTDAEALCRKNNLSMVEMLQPFARVKIIVCHLFHQNTVIGMDFSLTCRYIRPMR